MELIHQFQGHLNVDNSVEETALGEDYFYALNVVKDTNVSNDNKVETVVGCVAVPTSTYLDANSACIGIVPAPKDDIAYLCFYNSNASKHCILQLAPTTATYSIPGSVLISGNTTITYTNNTNLVIGDSITGTNIPPFTIVTAVLGNTSCVLSQAPTGSGTVTLTGSRTSDTISLVIQYSGLAFTNTKATRVTGFALGGLLYITNNLNETYCISLTRYAGGSTPTNVEEIYMLKRGPRYAPYTDYAVGVGLGLGKGQDGTGIYNNNIYSDVQFAVQYQYADGQLSVLSPYSVMIRRLSEAEQYNYIRIRLTQDLFSTNGNNTVSGNSTVTLTSGNTIGLYPGMYIDDGAGHTIVPYLTRIASITDLTHFVMTANASSTSGPITLTFTNQIDTIPYLVTQVNLFARNGQTGTFVQVGQITRSLGGTFATNYIDYKGVTLGNVLESHYLQQFENLPQQVGTMCAAGSRSWIGNYTEGYAKYDSSNITWGGVSIYKFNYSDTVPGFSTFSELSTFKIGFVLRDVNLRVMGVVTQPNYVFNIPTFVAADAGHPMLYIAKLAATVLTNLPAWVYDVGIVMTKDLNKSYFIKDTCKNGQWVSLTSVINNGITVPIQHFSLLYPNGIIVQDPTFFSSTSAGMTAGTYNNISPTSTSGSGTLATFTFVVSSATAFTSIKCTSEGKNYAVGDTITFNASLFGGGGTGSSIWTVTAVGNGAKYFALDISPFANAGKYYTWQSGDRISFYAQPMLGVGTPFTQDLLIEAFDGTYVYCTPSSLLSQNLGITLFNTAALYSTAVIYRPITDTSAVSNLFYEVPMESWIPKNLSQTILTSIDASLKSYSWGTYFLNQSGTCSIPDTILEGDCVLGSSSYIRTAGPPALNLVLQQMAIRGNPVWNTPGGRTFVQTRVDLAQKSTYARYGGTFVSGTSINQLAEFSGSSESNISVNAGTLQKLQPTVRDSSQSSAILAICNTDTYSIYINEAVITTGNANAIVSSTVNVIGDVRQQQSGYGTLHPESVVMDNYGAVYWFDTLQRSYVRYASNGIFPVSIHKMSSYFYYQSLVNTGSELVFSAYDPFYEMIYVCFTNVNGGGGINGDATKLTVAYDIFDERWTGHFSTSFPANLGGGFFAGSKNMYSFFPNGGVYLWKHTPFAPYGFIQGTQQKFAISLSLVPQDKTNLHDWKVLKIQGSPSFLAWSAGIQFISDSGLSAVLTNKNGQRATLSNNRPSGEQEFEAEENIIYAVIKYDENSVNGISGTVDSSSCLGGDPITSNTLQVAIQWTGNVYKYIRTVAVGYERSRGHDV